MSEIEARSRPVQRHAGFDVSAVVPGADPTDSSSGRTRTTTSGTIVKASDGDVEMSDDKKAVQPLPIPGSVEQRGAPNGAKATTASTRSPGDLPTPPDNILLSTSAEGGKRETGATAAAARLPSLHPNILSPRITSIPSSHVSSGPASVASSHWSPGRSSDPHLYSISAQPYVYSSVKPYLSTSFQTSAERGGASESNHKLDDRNSMEQDEDDDVFGNTSQALGLTSTGAPSPPQLRRSNDMEREDGDAAGVFSFSSPYFGPRSLESSDIPPLSPPPTDPQKRSQRLMSPGWTAATLGKMSLNGPSPESATNNPRIPPLGQSPHQASALSSAAQMSALQSRSLPMSAGPSQTRKPSFHRRPPAQDGPRSYTHSPGLISGNSSSMLHPNSPYHLSNTSAIRSRSTSQSRKSGRGIGRSSMHQNSADVDDDETDEEAMVMDRLVIEEDDDATEDEADQRISRFKAHTIRNAHRFQEEGRTPARAIGAPIPLHRHPSGQATTMSASFERANSGLSRQYTSDRYAGSAASHYSAGRHHPYALGSSGASPSNAGVLSSFSPSSARVAMGRRRSSFGNGSAAGSPQPGHGMVHQLSHSPRYVGTRPAGAYYDQQAAYHPHPSSLPAHAYHASNGQNYGESPDAAGLRRLGHSHSSALHQQSGQGAGDGDDEEDEEDEDEEDEEDGEDEEDEDDHEDDADNEGSARQEARLQAKTSRSRPSHSAKQASVRISAPASTSGAGEVESSEMNEVSAIRERLGGAANCSAFISKLWYLMCRPELYSRYIHWSESGDSVILSNDPDINNEFAAEVLPKLFKHGNNASFVRQLNLYGFQRVPSSRLLDAAETRAAKLMMSGVSISTALQLYGPHSSFAHPRFRKDQESLLPSMKPRSSKKTKKNGQTNGTGGREADSEPEDE